MNTSMISASVTMGQLQKKVDTISNNIANINTNGYKRRDVQFSDLLFQQVNNNQPFERFEVGRNTPNGIRVGSGAKVANDAIRMDQGSFTQTDRPLDLAIGEENVFFEILQPSGEGEVEVSYTRDGAFYLSEVEGNEGVLQLVDSNGAPVSSVNGESILVPIIHKDILVTENGTVQVTEVDGDQLTVGQIQLTRIDKPQLLLNEGSNYFRLPDLEELGFQVEDVVIPLNQNDGKILTRTLESSNVDLGKEMNELLLTQRSIQFNSSAIRIADEMSGLINGIRK